MTQFNTSSWFKRYQAQATAQFMFLNTIFISILLFEAVKKHHGPHGSTPSRSIEMRRSQDFLLLSGARVEVKYTCSFGTSTKVQHVPKDVNQLVPKWIHTFLWYSKKKNFN